MSHVGKRPRERSGLRGRRRRAGLCLGRQRAGPQEGGRGEPTCTWGRKEIRLLIQAEERYTTGRPELNPQPGKDRGGSVPGAVGDQGPPQLTTRGGRPLRCRQHPSPLR